MIQGMAHWRNSSKAARFLIFDARSALPLVLFFLHIEWWTFWTAIATSVVFFIIERFGMDTPMAIRFVRRHLAGAGRFSVLPLERRLMKGTFKSRTLKSLALGVVVAFSGVTYTPQAMADFEIIKPAPSVVAVAPDQPGDATAPGFIFVADPCSRCKAAVTDDGALTHIGKVGDKGPIVNGFGVVPLEDFITAVIPKDWTASYSETVDKKQTVRWIGGKNWVDLVSDVLGKHKLHGVADWNKKELFISDSLLAYNVPNSQVKPAEKVVKKVAPTYIYTLKEGMDLSENVMEWAKQVGWQVSWKSSVDYLVTFNVELGDDFEVAIARVMAAYRDAGTPLSAMFYRGNKVLEITSLQGGFNHKGLAGE